MTSKQFIEKSIEGGWNYNSLFGNPTEDFQKMIKKDLPKYLQPFMDSIVLDPLAWKAVFPPFEKPCWACKGKKYFEDFFTKEIDYSRECGNCECTGIQIDDGQSKENMHRMVDVLCEGGSLEQFLETL